MLTSVRFSANVLSEGEDFPSAYQNKSGRIGTHLSLVPTCQNVRIFISTHYCTLLLKGPTARNSGEFSGELVWFIVFEILS